MNVPLAATQATPCFLFMMAVAMESSKERVSLSFIVKCNTSGKGFSAGCKGQFTKTFEASSQIDCAHSPYHNSSHCQSQIPFLFLIYNGSDSGSGSFF